MKIATLLIIFAVISSSINAQKSDTSRTVKVDTVTLQSVKVSAFTSEQTKLKDVPASISVLNKNDLQRFDNTSLVSVMNTLPGVRMEERSPGSYRLSIRGSLLRSPFGVRDVKVYWDDIPMTDATGNTYINLIDLNHLQSIEVIRGPASSLYGASTAGAVILHSAEKISVKNKFNLALSGGSHSLFNEEAGWQTKTKNFYSNLQQSHYQSHSYRQQSAQRKDVLKWNGLWKINPNQTISFLTFYTNLFYQTPGGLTLQEYNQDPSLARLANVQEKAAVYNKTFFGGLTYKWIMGHHFSNTTSFVSNHTDFMNPFTTNYEKRNEWNYSGRTSFYYNYGKKHFQLQALAGGEIQYNVSHIDDYGNSAGVPDTVQFKDLVHINQYFLFAHLNMNIGKYFVLQNGVSLNTVDYWYIRTSDPLPLLQTKVAGPLLAPRFSGLYKLNKSVSVYATIEKGFSPPTLAEIRPSTGYYYGNLEPEYGWNYEAGIKGTLFKNRLDINSSVYYYLLQHAIVQRSDSVGAVYFINSGSTIQKGIELSLKGYVARPGKNDHSFISYLNVWNSLTYQPYKFKLYIYDTSNYSGNRLTGVPRFTDVIGIDAGSVDDYYANITLNCTSAIPLDDANDAYAKPYQLLQLKIGKHIETSDYPLNIYLGVDNVLNQSYSLGNDINAYAGRYYNPAPKRNFFLGIKVDM